jgi:hypothetical protein
MGRERSRAAAAEESSIRRAAREVINLIGILLDFDVPASLAIMTQDC